MLERLSVSHSYRPRAHPHYPNHPHLFLIFLTNPIRHLLACALREHNPTAPRDTPASPHRVVQPPARRSLHDRLVLRLVGVADTLSTLLGCGIVRDGLKLVDVSTLGIRELDFQGSVSVC